MDPFASVRAKNKAQGLNIRSQEEVERAKLEQQAKARQMVLQQQAISTAAAASKTQREVYIGNLQQVRSVLPHLPQLVLCINLMQCFHSKMSACTQETMHVFNEHLCVLCRAK